LQHLPQGCPYNILKAIRTMWINMHVIKDIEYSNEFMLTKLG